MSAAKPKVVVAMSGGVDSSVAAAMLLRDGYDVMGVFMRLGSPKGVADEAEGTTNAGKPNKQGCCSVLDASDARRVAGILDIPFYVLNFQDDFAKVIDYFAAEYDAGRTPNPCVRCNDWLKFGKLARYAEAVGAQYVASGHYARVGAEPVTGEPTLMRGVDHRKDQSYVLFGIPASTIAHTLLPIGALDKPTVRAMAQEFGLPTYNKPDSQEICFVPDQDYAGLLRRRNGGQLAPGEIVDTAGNVLGTHDGYQQYTIGQRKGLGVATGSAAYVTAIDPKSRRVTLGVRDELLRGGLVARQVNILSSRLAVGSSVRVTAKIRYNAEPVDATATRTAPDELRVTFAEPQSAVTPGQAVVLYDGDAVLGGGWIESAT